jgi:hypothetical protein
VSGETGRQRRANEPSPAKSSDELTLLQGQLLKPSRFRLDLRPENENAPSSPPPKLVSGNEVVVVLTRIVDVEMDALEVALTRLGTPFLRINIDQIVGSQVALNPLTGQLAVDGRTYHPSVVWLRHFSERALSASAAGLDYFVRDSWKQLAVELIAGAPVAIGHARLSLTAQFAAATASGFSTPDTVISTAYGQRRRSSFVKALSHHFVENEPGLLDGVFPESLDPDRVISLPLEQPVIFQEYVEHETELRVYYSFGDIISYEVRKQAARDLWVNEGAVSIVPTRINSALESCVRRTAQALELLFGAFDLLIKGQRATFLEVNVGADWRWYEQKAGGPAAVTRSVARSLARLAEVPRTH